MNAANDTSKAALGGYVDLGGRRWRWFLVGVRLVIADHDVSPVGGHVFRVTRRLAKRPAEELVLLAPDGELRRIA